MSNAFLTEPSSQREDNRIWVWRYADPVNVPIKVNLRRRDTGDVYANIPTSFRIRFLIKEDLRDDDAVLEKSFEFVSPSVFVVKISTEEVVRLRAGKVYHVGMALYDDRDNFIRTIISDLPLRVDKSALSNSVF